MTRKTEACAVLKESDPPKDFEVELNASDCDIMLVGHIPFLPKLAGRLVAGRHSADLIAFAQSALVCLERDDEGKWRVGWMVTPELFTGGCSR
jgi:phosphohistidine phosphatase